MSVMFMFLFFYCINTCLLSLLATRGRARNSTSVFFALITVTVSAQFAIAQPIIKALPAPESLPKSLVISRLISAFGPTNAMKIWIRRISRSSRTDGCIFRRHIHPRVAVGSHTVSIHCASFHPSFTDLPSNRSSINMCLHHIDHSP